MSTDSSDRLALTIQRARKARGWSQARLAEAAGVSTNTVGSVELAKPVRKGNLRAILDALDMTPEAMDAPKAADAPTEVEPDVQLVLDVVRKYLEGRPAGEARSAAAQRIILAALDRQ